MSASLKLLLVVLAVSVLGLGAWGVTSLILDDPAAGSGEDDLLGWEDDFFGEEEDEAAAGFDPLAPENEDELPMEERELLEIESAESESAESRPTLEIEGRVVSKSGQPLGNASINLHMRRGAAPGTPGYSVRGRRGWRQRFRPSQLGKTLTTGPDGKFKISGQVYSQTLFEITAKHAAFAPVVVQRSWKAEEGKLALEDIVLDDGATGHGLVVTDKGVPLPEAKVSYVPTSRNWSNGSYRLRQLVDPATTDSGGRFEIGNLPPGDFRLTVEAPKYISSATKNLKAEPGRRIDVGRITLVLGAELSGFVRDKQGRPVATAQVDIGTSNGGRQEFERLFAELRRLNNQTQIAAARERLKAIQTQWRGLGRGGRRNLRTKTDAKGAFHLDGLPHGALRVSVRHAKFIDENVDPVEPAKTPEIEVHLDRRLALAGVVLDSGTNQPIELYGVRARRIGGWSPDRGRRGRRGPPGMISYGPNQDGNVRIQRARLSRPDPRAGSRNNGNRRQQLQQLRQQQRQQQRQRQLTPEQQKRLEQRRREQEDQQRQRDAERQRREAERQRREAERKARRAQQETYMKQRLGASGIVPGWTPKPTKKQQGRFEVGDLQPGRYVIDIFAPGYVKQAAGPFELDRGQVASPATVRMDRGRSIEGIVLNRHDQKPIAEARVELFIPPAVEQPRNVGNPAFLAMRPENLGRVLETVRTDKEGRFRFPPQRPGVFRLRVRAGNYSSHVERTLVVQASGDKTGLVFKLSRGGRIYGTVRNLKKGEHAMVLLASTQGFRRNVPVNSESGEYEAKGLDSGSYFVRLHLPARARGMMRYFVEALTRPGMQPNVQLPPGAEARFDLDAAIETTGSLEGKVMLNGVAGRGFEIRLRPDENGANITLETLQPGMPGGQRMLRALGNMLRARTNRDGAYKIEAVPPGDYILEVRRQSRRNNRTFLREAIRIVEGGPTRRDLGFTTGEVQFNVVDPQSGKEIRRARLAMALSHEAGNLQPKEWRRLPSFSSVDIRGGKGRAAEIPTGEYSYWIGGGGLQPKTGRVFVGAGKSTPVQTLHVKQRKPRKPATAPQVQQGQKKK